MSDHREGDRHALAHTTVRLDPDNKDRAVPALEAAGWSLSEYCDAAVAWLAADPDEARRVLGSFRVDRRSWRTQGRREAREK